MSNTPLQRGEVVIVDFSRWNSKAGVRPAVIVQNDHDNQRMNNTIVAQITTNLRRAGEATQLLIDQQHPDWAASSLRAASVINASNLATVAQIDVTHRIGQLSAQTMLDVDGCLKAALDLSS